jgi:general secretion pathway protein K
VLWLTAALAAIGFALASTVRTETDRTANSAEGARAYYLASGAVERATLELLWSAMNSSRRLIPLGAPVVNYEFPGGVARVEIVPETSKLNLNTAPPAELYRLCLALGLEPERSREIAAAIDEWRRPEEAPQFDSFYLSLTPSFRPPHASFQENEELLLVKGVTPDIYYGTYAPSAEAEGPRLEARSGLADCLSVFGSADRVDANTAPPAVLAAVGLSPYAIHALLERRRAAPLTSEQLGPFLTSLGAQDLPLRVGGNSIFLIRATARPRLAGGGVSDLRRTVAARVKYMPSGYDSPIHVLRWYDSAWSN